MKKEYLVEEVKYKGYTIGIYTDNDPEDPRNEDCFGHMICFHRRYSLGDKHTMTIEECKELALHGNIIYLNLFLYDHSGITIRASLPEGGNPFYGHLPQGHAEFDTGQVGIIYVTLEEIKKEFGIKYVGKRVKEKAYKILMGEVERYNDYITGSVYGYQITKDSEDDAGDIMDSCWGFYPDRKDSEEDGLKYMLDECRAIIDQQVPEENYIIRELAGYEEDRLYWNNDTGWGSREGATVFSRSEKEALRLPIDGLWVDAEI